MKNNKLVNLLRCLSAKEWKMVRKMANSPYFTSNQKIDILFGYLEPFRPKFDLNNTPPEEIFSAVFKTEKYSNTKLRKLYTESVQIVNQLFLIEKIKKDEDQVQLNLLEIYQKRNITNEYNLLERRLLDKFEIPQTLTPKFLLKRIKLNDTRLTVLGIGKKNERRLALRNLYNDLENFFDIKEGIISAEEVNYKNVLSHSHWKQSDSIPFLLILYQNLANLTFEYDPKLFKILMELYHELPDEFPFEHKINFLQYLQNANTRQYNLNPKEHIENTFQIYKEAANIGIQSNPSRISVTLFNGIVTLGTKLGKYQWVENFMEDYQIYLPKSEKKEGLFIAKLSFLFNKGEFEKAFDHSNKYKAKTTISTVNVNITYLRTVFELFIKDESYYSLLNNKINSAKRWTLRNKEINEKMKNNYLTFLSFLKEFTIHRYERKVNSDSLEKLKNKVFNQNGLPGKDWFLDKLETL